jgi:hypothetical protein
MNGVLRIDVTIARKISEKLNADDIRLLVNAFSDPDKTMCLETTESLYALKDNGVYNNVLILKEIVPSLSEPERLRVRNEVVRSVPSSYVKYARTGSNY